jgi:glucokinase
MSADALVAAFDVGGTSIKAALVDGAGTSHRSAVLPTRAEQGPDAVVAGVCTVVRELVAGSGAVAVGVAVPGSVDDSAGIARYSANLGWRDVPLRALLAAETGLPVAVAHDVAAAGLADATFGATVGTSESLLVVIGTGIAAVARSGGQVVRGAGRLAGEIGHLPVHPDGERCPCGQRGCLERYASAAAISRAYGEFGAGDAVSAAEVSRRRTTDAAAGRAWDRAVEALAIALASATMLLDPEVIALAGGLSDAGDALLSPLVDAFTQRITWRPVPRLVISPLGGRAGLLGAALVARSVVAS